MQISIDKEVHFIPAIFPSSLHSPLLSLTRSAFVTVRTCPVFKLACEALSLSRLRKRRPQRPTKGKEIVVPKFAEENDCKKLMHSREEEEEASSSPSLLLEFFPAD